jgi:uncharacterized protein (TIGR04222 family)
MDRAQQALLDELNNLRIEEAGAELTFAQRLAQENGWSPAYTDRVIVEYKRFLYLAATREHVVCPSEQVDQAWHLHLTYTRSYWDDLCRRVLRRPLHHSPTKGGRAELSKFVDLYVQTIDSYIDAFGQVPPDDIWPSTRQRFGEDAKHVTVNPSRYWIIPKPRWPRAFRSLSRRYQLLAGGLFVFPFAASWNLLEWKGPDFLGAYVMIATGAAVVAFLLRMLLVRASSGSTMSADHPLDAYEVACLAAGKHRAVEAAFASMVQAGTLEVTTTDSKILGIFPWTTRSISQGRPLPADAPDIERALYDATFAPAHDWQQLLFAGLPAARTIQTKLVDRGLVHSWFRSCAFLLPVLIMALPLLLAIPKLMLGFSRGRPIGYLFLATLGTVVAAFLFLAAIPRVTRLGGAVVGRLRRHRASSIDVAKENCKILSPADLAFTIGLFGAGLLAVGPLSQVHALLPRTREPLDPSGTNNACSTGCTTNDYYSSSHHSGGGCGGGGCGGCGS